MMRRFCLQVWGWLHFVGRICPGGEGRIGIRQAWDIAGTLADMRLL